MELYKVYIKKYFFKQYPTMKQARYTREQIQDKWGIKRKDIDIKTEVDLYSSGFYQPITNPWGGDWRDVDPLNDFFSFEEWKETMKSEKIGD